MVMIKLLILFINVFVLAISTTASCFIIYLERHSVKMFIH